MTSTETEETAAAEGATEPDAHYMCAVCYPNPYPGMKAVCGHELLGIPAPMDAPLCEMCVLKELPHVLGHMRQ